MIINKSTFQSEVSYNYFCKVLIKELGNRDIKITFNKDGIVVISKDINVLNKIKKMTQEFREKNSILNEREKMDYLYSLVLNDSLVDFNKLEDKRLLKFWIIINKRIINSYKKQKSVSLEEVETTHTVALIENIKRERKLKKGLIFRKGAMLLLEVIIVLVPFKESITHKEFRKKQDTEIYKENHTGPNCV